MKAVFVDTYALVVAQREGTEPAPPLIVYDLDDDTAERASEIKIHGDATVRFDMAPQHNLARVWIEAERTALDYDGAPTTWDARAPR